MHDTDTSVPTHIKLFDRDDGWNCQGTHEEHSTSCRSKELVPSFWPYAAMYVSDVTRHNSAGRLWSQPAFGEVVAVTRPGPRKALEPRGQVGSLP
eukprot:12926405-Prorocentrum_lima.AAC.1